MADSLRVLCLVYGHEAASCRFRIRQFAPSLSALGIRLDLEDLAVPRPQRRRVLASASEYDLVLVHRVLPRLLGDDGFRRRVKNYVFDYDDAILFRDSGDKRGFHSWQRRLRFRRMVRGARGVIAGNDYLADWARRDNPNVTVIPTCVELGGYPVQAALAEKPPTMGWIGTRANLMYLDAIGSALSRVGRGPLHPPLKIVSDAFIEIPGLEVIHKDWALAEEADDVMSFGVGLMPLPDDPWTRGKCALKILQYMAGGVAVVCSPVGANRQVVRDGENGYFARTPDEWVARLVELLSDEATRARFARAGRRTVEQGYSVEVQAGRLAATLAAAAAGVRS